jgi:hypothetical protein
VGLYQFLFKFIPEPQEKPLSTKFSNFIQAVPNDDDIDKSYNLEKKDYLEKLELERSQKLRLFRFNIPYPVSWMGEVHIKCHNELWEKSFLVFQRKRLVWWHKESDIDEGKSFEGQLLLYGHAGVMPPLSVEVRETRGEEDQIVVVFGRNCIGMPLRCAVFCHDLKSSSQLKEHITKACQ